MRRLKAMHILSSIHASLLVLLVFTLVGCGADEQPTNEMIQPEEEHTLDVAGLLKNLTIDDYQARFAASSALTAIGGDAVPAILVFLRNQTFEESDDTSFRAKWESVNVLGRIKDPRAAEDLLERILRDEENHVRWRAIWALSAIDHEGKQEALRFHLANEDEQVRWNAAVALATYHDANSIKVLSEGLRSKESWKRWEAVYSLGLIGNSEAASYALGALNDDTKRVRQEAVMTISKSGDESFRSTLLPLINDSEPGVRWRAAQALSHLGQPNATGMIKDMLERELDGPAKKELERILDNLG